MQSPFFMLHCWTLNFCFCFTKYLFDNWSLAYQSLAINSCFVDMMKLQSRTQDSVASRTAHWVNNCGLELLEAAVKFTSLGGSCSLRLALVHLRDAGWSCVSVSLSLARLVHDVFFLLLQRAPHRIPRAVSSLVHPQRNWLYIPIFLLLHHLVNINRKKMSS